MLRRVTIRVRIILLVLATILVTGVSIGLFQVISNAIEKFVGEQSGTIYLDEEKRRVHDAVSVMAQSLASQLEEKKLPEEKISTIRKAIEGVVYEPDKSGYFFVYTLDCVVISLYDTSKIGKNLSEVKDVNNVPYVQRLAEAARNGGGFVSYLYKKPGQGDEPKLAYSMMIPGTDYWIGSGIYIDNVKVVQGRISLEVKNLVGEMRFYMISVLAVVVLLFYLPLAWAIFRSIVVPITAATAVAQAVADGRLDVVVNTAGDDEATLLQRSLKTMIGTLHDNITNIQAKGAEAQRSADESVRAMHEAQEAKQQAEYARRDGMQSAATQLEAVADIMAKAVDALEEQIKEAGKGALEQATRVSETATAMEEMNATVMEVAGNASHAAEISAKTREYAEQGAGVVTQSVNSIMKVQEQSVTLRTGMHTLGGHASSISQVMGVISDIADQTNLLALNAAIEAARAGEAGRGFAVVADEVRKLAEKTIASTTDVGEAIHGIQASVDESVHQVEVTVQNIESATALAAKSGEALNNIVRMVDEVADQVRGIATASEEQSAASEEINRSIVQMNSIASDTSERMKKAAKSVTELNTQADVLDNLIDTLKKG